MNASDFDKRSASIEGDATNSDIIAGNGNVINRNTIIFLKDVPDNTQEPIDEPNPYPNPYRGLEAFREEHAPNFFGRDDVILKLQDVVCKKPLVAVIGASGSGKSSLVFAGLVPKLRQDGQWVIADFRPKTQPFVNLALSLIPLLYQDKIQQAEKLKELAEKLFTGAIGLPQIIQLILQEHQNKRLLLITDQFEELYTLNSDKSLQQRFADRLLQALSESSFSLLLTMRADFMSQAIDYRPFAEALNAHHTDFFAPMSEPELRNAIEMPAENCGVKLESGLTERILKDLGNEPGTLPLLEFALTQLWEKQRFRQMTHQAYSDIGGVNQALARHADKVYAEFSPEEQNQVRRIFVQLVHPGQGTEDTRQVATFEQVKEENRNLIAKLADKRLIVTGQHEETKQETIEVVHEALIRHWQPLKQWMNEDREFRVWQERLRAAMRQWDDCGRDDGALLRGVPLAEAEEKLRERKDQISTEEISYIQSGVALREKEIAEKERARQEREKLQKRIAWIFGVAMVVALILSGEIWLKYLESDRNLRQAKINEIEAMTQTAKAVFLSNDELGGLLTGIKAAKIAKKFNIKLKLPTLFDFRDIVYGVHEKNRLQGHLSEVNSVAFSPDGKILASASGAMYFNRDRSIRLWDIEHGKQLKVFSGYQEGIYSIAFSPDGKILASGGGLTFNKNNNTIRLWDTTYGKELKVLSGHQEFVHKVSFSPDGKILSSTSQDGIKLWNISEGKEINTFNYHSPVLSVSFSPDGKYLALGGWKDIQLWDILERKQFNTLIGHQHAISCLSFSPDGKQLISGSDDKTLKLWNIPEGEELKTFVGHQEGVNSVSFSPDGKQIVSGSYDKTVKLWDIAERNKPKTFSGHQDIVKTVTFSMQEKITFTFISF